MKTKDARDLADRAHRQGIEHGFMSAVITARYFALQRDTSSLFCGGKQPWEEVTNPVASLPAALGALLQYMAENCEHCLFRLGWDAIDEVLLCGTKDEAQAQLAKVSEMLEEAATALHTRH